jgi:lysophospholipase L1-like esterase
MTTDRDRIAALLADKESRVKWLFTGDSITHGALHTFGYRDYPEHFDERVRYELRRPLDYVLKTGTNGWRITNIKAELQWNVLQFSPNVVSLNFGMNDCTAGMSNLERFRADYLHVVRTIRDQTNAALILHTPNAIEASAVGRAETLPAYAQAVREIAGEVGAVLVDHFAYWESNRERGAVTYWLSDPIHPNEYGHRVIAHTLLRELGLWDETSAVCRLFVP